MAGFAAAALHDLAGFRPGRIELVVPVNSYCTHPFATLHRYAGAKLTTVDGIAVTTIAQTLFDLPTRVSPWRLERAMDDALLDEAPAIADLDERLPLLRRQPPSRDCRGSGRSCSSASTDGWTPPESELEARLIAVLAKLPSAPTMRRVRPRCPGDRHGRAASTCCCQRSD